MKPFFIIITAIVMSLGAFAQETNTITITGKIFRPADTLVLLKVHEDVRYRGVKIPTGKDSLFSASFEAEGIEEYMLIFLSDFKNGGWRRIRFFTDSENIRFELYDLPNADRNKIFGSDLTDKSVAFKQAVMDRWYPSFMELDKKQEAGIGMDELKRIADSLTVEMTEWQHNELRDYPDEIALSEYHDLLESYRENALLTPIMKGYHEYWTKKPRINSTSDVIADLYYTNVENLVDKKFWDFRLYDSNGEGELLSSVFTEDGFVLLDLWSPWCSPCIKKSKNVLNNLEAIRANGVNVIGVIGGVPTMKKYEADKRRFPYPWPVYPEVSDAQKIWQKYGFESGGGGQILINGDGIIVAVNPSVEEILSLTGGD